MSTTLNFLWGIFLGCTVGWAATFAWFKEHE